MLSTLLYLTMAAVGSPVPAHDVTGVWRDDKGREYRIRQVGAEVYWSMDARPEAVNAFRGTLKGDALTGLWADLPGGRGKSLGNLQLRIVDQNLMLKVGGAGIYDAQIWRRVVMAAEREGGLSPAVPSSPEVSPPPTPSAPASLPAPVPSPATSPATSVSIDVPIIPPSSAPEPTFISQPPLDAPGPPGDATLVSMTRAPLASAAFISLSDGVSLTSTVISGSGTLVLMKSRPAAPIPGALSSIYSVVATHVPDPGVKHTPSLSFPMPAGETDVAAYSVSGGALFKVPHVAHNGRIEIEAAQVRVIPAEAVEALREGGAVALPGAGIDGYILAKSGLAADDAECVNGGRGETYRAPGHSFTIRFEVTAGCELAAQVSSWLQEALVFFRQRYVDPRGNPARSDLSPQNRMEVYLRGGRTMAGVNAEYQSKLSWTGFMLVNAAAAADNPGVTREVMFHEFFHAIQDEWANLVTGQFAGAWWFEATAEWGGYQARRASFTDIVKDTLENYGHFLSVPPQSSTSFSSSANYAYGVAPLIDFVERRSDRYVQRALRKGNARSSVRYAQLVEDGGLRHNFPTFVKDVLRAADTAGRAVGTSGRVVIGQNTLGVTTYPNAVLTAEAESETERRTDADARKRPIVFPVAEAAPMTARIYEISVNSLPSPLSARVLVETDGPGPGLEVYAGAGDLALIQGEAIFKGLGQGIKLLRVAVINPDPDRGATFHLTVKLDEAEPEGAMYRLVSGGVTTSPPPRACIQPGETEFLMACGDTGEKYQYLLETPFPKAFNPGVPFTIRVRIHATQGSSANGLDHDIALLISGASLSPSRFAHSRSSPTVGYALSASDLGGARRFIPSAVAEFEVLIDGSEPPPVIRLRLMPRWGVSIEGHMDEWLSFEYRR